MLPQLLPSIMLLAITAALSACGAKGLRDYDPYVGGVPSGSGAITQHGGASLDDSPLFGTGDAASFPKLKLSAENVPVGSSDFDRLEMKVQADPAFSHYAYKISSLEDCEQDDGYFVNDVKQPMIINQEAVPFGPVYLCLIGYHFSLRRWQPISQAKIFNWEKVPFKREIESYYEFVMDEAFCNQKTVVRIPAVMKFDGTKGSYTFTPTGHPNCPGWTPVVGEDPIVAFKVSATHLRGSHIDGELNGWFELKFTNAERTKFTGTWGYGEPGVEPLGVWNSVAQ